ncbi:leucine-rich repeat flightless-interacting protein 1 isoform X3 [Microcaecilia unicolor]|uniref:Leucine-rich repeat flightless-interacting protein 1 isoform X3 n=1 Tax=Microcaecilia unicolor TaxID=1415580 RepID=A0A6P7YP31_9AMPH|nr:leucine-rich repeat flightless-interacting protein 1 isoform X3 [Microcaecilia unicolor]
MATPGPGRKRQPHSRERLTAEDDALNQIAREAEARLAAKRAARAEAREIRMRELERQQKEIYQVQKKYYGLDTKWGDIEQWMEGNECYSQRSQRNALASNEDERISVGSRGSLRPSEYNCYFGSGSRASSRTSSVRASPVVEERSEKDFIEKGAHAVPSLSTVTLASLGGSSSRRGSGDTSISIDTEASIREMKDLLTETEEKYKKAMVSNAQLDNEKTNFMYQVDILKDILLELEEQLAESKRQYEEKSKELERQKYTHSVLQFQFNEVKEILQKREEVLLEMQQLQQEKEICVREISDLQETIEWKDKKIGALERQKEFFDCIRSERDDLRSEAATLKEQLKEHGIILNSEIAINGETSNKNDRHLEPSTKVNLEISPVLKSAEAVHPGRANEVKMKNESLEEVGKSEILQITENKECKEETETQEVVKAVTEQKTLHHDENAETKGTSGHDNDFIVTCANSRLEQIPGVSECVFSAKSHGINELVKSKFVPFHEEAECVCNITNEHYIVKHEISDAMQIQGNIIGQTWDHHKPKTQHETQTEIQSWGKMKQEGFMDKERECCNEEFQDALDFVVNSNKESTTDLLALGEDESNEGMGTKEIETYNNVKIKIKKCKNESIAENSDLETQQEECFDMACDKVECDKKRESSGIEEVQSWEVQNNSVEGLQGSEVDSGIISNEIRQKPTESEKTMLKCNSKYQTEESKEEQVRESMISPGDHSQKKHTKIQVQATIKNIKKKNKKKKNKKDIVETEITQTETSVKYQCSHDIKTSILENPDGDSVNNVLPMDEEEPNRGLSTQGNSEHIKLYFEDAEMYQKMNQGLKCSSPQAKFEKGKQNLTIEIEQAEIDCTTMVHSREVAEQSFNADEKRNLVLQESGKQLLQLSQIVANVKATELDSQFLESTEESDQAATQVKKKEEISVAETKIKKEQDRKRNKEIIDNRQLDNENKSKKIETENGLLAVKTVTRQIKQNAEGPEETILSDMDIDKMETQGEEIVEDDGEAFGFDNETNQVEENSEKHYVDKANIKEFEKAKEQKSQVDDGDSMEIEEKYQSKENKIENEDILNKDKVTQQIEAEKSEGAEHFQADMYQSYHGLDFETEEKTNDDNRTEETSVNVTKKLGDAHEDVAQSQSEEDVRKDEIVDKGSRKGKGKNKEDCLVA